MKENKPAYSVDTLLSLIDKVSACNNKRLCLVYYSEWEREEYYKLYGDTVGYIEAPKVYEKEFLR